MTLPVLGGYVMKRAFFLWMILFLALPFGFAQQNSIESKAVSIQRDGSHDFDFEVGTWKIHLKRLLNPLTGSTSWVEFDGSTTTRKVWDGKAFLEEFETDGPSGHIEG